MTLSYHGTGDRKRRADGRRHRDQEMARVRGGRTFAERAREGQSAAVAGPLAGAHHDLRAGGAVMALVAARRALTPGTALFGAHKAV